MSASESVKYVFSLFQANILHLFSWLYIPNAVWWEEVSLPSHAAEISLLWRPQCSFWVRINLLSHQYCNSGTPLVAPFHILGTSHYLFPSFLKGVGFSLSGVFCKGLCFSSLGFQSLVHIFLIGLSFLLFLNMVIFLLLSQNFKLSFTFVCLFWL